MSERRQRMKDKKEREKHKDMAWNMKKGKITETVIWRTKESREKKDHNVKVQNGNALSSEDKEREKQEKEEKSKVRAKIEEERRMKDQQKKEKTKDDESANWKRCI